MSNHLPFSLSSIDLHTINEFSTLIAQSRRKKIALVVQGGGQRGIFTAGVFDAFLEAGFDPFELYIGTSAGALTVSSFLSRQPGYSYNFIVNYTTNDEFFNLYKYLSQQKPLNLDWALQAISPDGDTPLNFQQARKTLIHRNAYACATRKDTLQDIYLPMYQENWREVLRATCAIPVLYNQPVNINDLEWVDGGVAAAVPVKEAWRQGAELVIVIRTEPINEYLIQTSSDGNAEKPQGVFDDWRERIEATLPQYIEKLSLHEPMDKIKNIHSDLTLRFESWKETRVNNEDSHYRNTSVFDMMNKVDQLNDREKVNAGSSDTEQLIDESKSSSWSLFASNNIERFLSMAGKSKSAEVMDMLRRYYYTYNDLNAFLVNLPDGLKVIQIAPESNLKSRALLSSEDDLEIDYLEGKVIGRQFLEHFADILNEKTTLKNDK
jgi:predicted patatin/cPLA2 family phospholipase